MDYATEIRLKLIYALLGFGGVLFGLNFFSNSSWAMLGGVMGFIFFATGIVMFISLKVVTGSSWLAQLASRHAEDEWDGELVHAEGSGLKVRYTFDHQGNPWFVAKDVCIAIGVKPPKKGDLKCGSVPLLTHGELICFSETNVQAYLTSLAMNNHAANRLLVNIRNNVLRKLEKQRDDKKRYS
jgi:hypothetical protein